MFECFVCNESLNEFTCEVLNFDGDLICFNCTTNINNKENKKR